METIKDAFTEYKKQLAALYHPNEIEAITILVISDLLNTSKAKIKAFPEQIITGQQQEQLVSVLTELATGKPVQYILGHTDFYGLTFKVNKSVLIPRPETEELVEWILKTVKADQPVSVLDIGTGSGCIPITLKKHLHQATIYSLDVSAEALVLARENAAANQVKVDFIEGDILLQPKLGLPKLDLIVSNPPYVTPADKEQMHSNVTNFEPHLALFVPQEDPLLFYDAISTFALQNLASDGFLFYEINENYGKETVELLTAKGFNNINLKKDMSGRDRMIKAKR